MAKAYAAKLEADLATARSEARSGGAQFGEPSIAMRAEPLRPTVPVPDDIPVPVLPRIHTVTSGESLSSISQRYYGTANRWEEIFNANRDVLEMATVGGYEALGLVRGGRLEVGAPADLVLVDLRRAHSWPVHNPLSAVIYNAQGGDVDTVLVAGKPLLRGGRITFLDEDELLERTGRLAADLRRRAGFPAAR